MLNIIVYFQVEFTRVCAHYKHIQRTTTAERKKKKKDKRNKRTSSVKGNYVNVNAAFMTTTTTTKKFFCILLQINNRNRIQATMYSRLGLRKGKKDFSAFKGKGRHKF